MRSKLVVDKVSVIEDDKVIVTEQIETKYTLEQVENRISNIRRDKERLINENTYILAEYAKLEQEEIDFKGYLLELQPEIEEIEKIK